MDNQKRFTTRLARALISCIFLSFISCATADRVQETEPGSPVAQAEQAIAEGSLVLDVRSPEEFATGHLKGAVNIPHTEIQSRIAEIADYQGETVVVYCASGRRAGIAKEALEAEGFGSVINAGGYKDVKHIS